MAKPVSIINIHLSELVLQLFRSSAIAEIITIDFIRNVRIFTLINT